MLNLYLEEFLVGPQPQSGEGERVYITRQAVNKNYLIREHNPKPPNSEKMKLRNYI